MACAFDLQCHQLTKIMGHQWAGSLTRYRTIYSKNIVTFQRTQKTD
jgi:hypothetical protein